MKSDTLRRKAGAAAVALMVTALLLPLLPAEALATRIWKAEKIPVFVKADEEVYDVLSRRITLKKRGNLSIAYNAECAVFSANPEARVAVSIFVDDEVVPVTATRNFCSANGFGSSGQSGWASHTSSVVVKLDPGEHKIVIRAFGIELLENDAIYWIADQSLTIIAEKN